MDSQDLIRSVALIMDETSMKVAQQAKAEVAAAYGDNSSENGTTNRTTRPVNLVMTGHHMDGEMY